MISLLFRAMTNDRERARKYLSLAAASERRAASARDDDLKKVFLQIAKEYCNLALQIKDPVKWRAMQKDRAKGPDCWGTRKGPAPLRADPGSS
jgi:hypothetical protein